MEDRPHFLQGGVLDSLFRAPAVVLGSSLNGKLLKRSMTLSSSAAVNASMDFGELGTHLTSRELWKIEWVNTMTFECHIMSVGDNSYWYIDSQTSPTLQVVSVTNAQDTKPALRISNGTESGPTTFTIKVLSDSIMIQETSSGRWLSCTKQGEVFLKPAADESTSRFFVGFKAGIYVNSVLGFISVRTFLSVLVSLRLNRLGFESLIPEKRACFLFILRGDHLQIVSARNKYFIVDDGQLTTHSNPKAPGKFRLVERQPDSVILLTADRSGGYVPLHFNVGTLSLNEPLEEKELHLVFLPESRVEVLTTPSGEIRVFPVFGVPVDEMAEKQDNPVPLFLEQSISFLRGHMSEEGLFRLSGSRAVIDEMKRSIDKGRTLEEMMAEESRIGENEVAGLLKMYIASVNLISSELLSELIDIEQMEELSANSQGVKVCATCGSHSLEYLQIQREAYRNIMNTRLSPVAYRTLEMLMGFLHDLAAQSEENKMSPSNIAIVMVPNLHPSGLPEQGPELEPRLSTAFQKWLIDYPQIFVRTE